jgi:hypothetical protein
MLHPVAGTGASMDRTRSSATAPGTTRRFALSRAEWATTSVAAVVSSAAYVSAGFPYLARGVVGDLAGFLLLGVAGVARGARLKHEALLCLALIGVVLLLDPQWPLRLSEPLWWGLFTIGLAAYVSVRRTICD